MQVEGLAPLLGEAPRILILGSMAGPEALRTGQYYAHPRNAFWVLIEDSLGEPVQALAYPDRVQLLQRRGIAVWNVLSSCWRPDSADANIDLHTAQLNDVASLVRAHPTLRRIAFNGRLPERLFVRRLLPALSDVSLDLRPLPASSAAFAAMRLADKRAAWRAALNVDGGVSAPARSWPR